MRHAVAAALLSAVLIAPGGAFAVEPSAPSRLVTAEQAIGSAARALLARLPATKSKDVQADRDALAAFYLATGDQPVWVSMKGLTLRGQLAVDEIAAAASWGLDPKDFTLPVIGADRSPQVLAAAEVELGLAVLTYARHARGGRVRPTDLSYNIDRELTLKNPRDVLTEAASASDVAAYLRGLHPRHAEFERLRQAYVKLTTEPAPPVAVAVAVVEDEEPAGKGKKSKKAAAKPPTREEQAARVLRNMEMWRWMPDDLGDVYIWANIPEFKVRVVKNGRVIHEERIIAGKPETQTPIFSDEMETVVLHPFWGVPNSIKINELLPGMMRGKNTLAKSGLRMQSGGRDIDPTQVDWRTADIRNFHVYQPPGGSNVLGVVKFLFPNSHQVYMHDTPTKYLFDKSQRTFSHGCMRVRNPVRLAEVVLELDKGWSSARVKSEIDNGPENNNIALDTKIPVHVTYFTMRAPEGGELEDFRDVYGHEKLIQMGLDGKAHLIVKRKQNLESDYQDLRERMAASQPSYGFFPFGGSSTGSSSGGRPDWAQRIFSVD